MPINIKRNVYAMANVDGQSAEITMYGTICEKQPTDWWTDEPIKGQFITLETFLEDLAKIQDCTKITIRMNSYGGDAGVSNTIHNRLRELARSGVATHCIVDGAAMSGGSLIMSACDTVEANPSSLIMIHKCWGFYCGGYNADELRQAATENDAWDKMQVECYTRKTGMSKDEILGMIAETTYMTGREAMEKGFVDAILEDAEPTTIAASASGNSLFVNGHKMHLAPGMILPQGIPTVNSEEPPSAQTNNNPLAKTSNKGGTSTMANTTEELRAQYPDLVGQIEAAAKETVPSAEASATAERARIQAIDDIAHLFSAELVQEAKYGEQPCSAEALAFRAAQAAAKNGTNFLNSMASDTQASGAQDVKSAATGEDDKELTEEEKYAQAQVSVKSLLGTDKKEGN
ncbi:Clp protease ClpP [Bengtsoniella intestinalis]|uniref:Clp protease ClpP n=1 Tax=Bengtsoniella intestinalis TaxID=3073143 RepID=UPI00391FBC6A